MSSEVPTLAPPQVFLRGLGVHAGSWELSGARVAQVVKTTGKPAFTRTPDRQARAPVEATTAHRRRPGEQSLAVATQLDTGGQLHGAHGRHRVVPADAVAAIVATAETRSRTTSSKRDLTWHL